MNKIRVSYIVGLLLGALMLSLVYSQTFTYSASRTFTVEVVSDPNADIAIIPAIYLGTGKGYVVDGLNGSGDFEFNFTAAPGTTTSFTPAFYIKNNLNQTVSVVISMTPPNDVEITGNVIINKFTIGIPETSLGTAAFSINIPAGENASINLSIEVLSDVSVTSSYPINLTISATYPS